jgi:hypothetical protein
LFIRASLEAGGVEATSSKEEIRMKLHGNHRTCPSSRQLICERVLAQRWSVREAAEAAGCSERTAAKWLARYRAGGPAVDRPVFAATPVSEAAVS